MRWTIVISLCTLFSVAARAQYELPASTYRLSYSPSPVSGMLPVAPQLKPPASFIFPESGLFVSYNRFQLQSGIIIPGQSVNSGLMLENNRGYMNLYDRGNLSIGVTGSRQAYTSLGFSNGISLGYGYAPADWITFYGNVYASDNMYQTERFKTFGISGAARIKVADRLYINGFGQYSVMNTYQGQLPPRMMYPSTSYGGSIEVKITDKFGIQGGVTREYDAFRRRWNTNYYAAPVFY